MMTQVNFDSIGGGSSVKTGTFEVTNASTAGSITPIDTGLGSSIKRMVIVGENPNASTGPFSIIGWDSVFPASYKYVQIGSGGGGNTVAIGTTQHVTLMLDKRLDTNNGVIEMSWTNLNPTNKNGTYYWYAE